MEGQDTEDWNQEREEKKQILRRDKVIYSRHWGHIIEDVRNIKKNK